MVAFLIFLALMVAFIVGGVCLSMYLYSSNRRGHLRERQLVTLSQEAFIEGQPYKQRKVKMDMGMNECARRVGGICLGILAVMVFLIAMFMNAAH